MSIQIGNRKQQKSAREYECMQLHKICWVGAWDYMRWKHISPLKDENGVVLAAKLMYILMSRTVLYFYDT